MKILHTSDWHIGRSLYGRKRYDEFSAFLDWLAEFMQIESVDALLVAGDVFDTSTPSNRAQEKKRGTGLKLRVSRLSGTRIDRRSVFGLWWPPD